MLAKKKLGWPLLTIIFNICGIFGPVSILFFSYSLNLSNSPARNNYVILEYTTDNPFVQMQSVHVRHHLKSEFRIHHLLSINSQILCCSKQFYASSWWICFVCIDSEFVHFLTYVYLRQRFLVFVQSCCHLDSQGCLHVYSYAWCLQADLHEQLWALVVQNNAGSKSLK